tara:strand:- start:5287 stop:5460 length:174 start_codon:yes stop_codon:yes gene_type:complete
MNFRTIKWVLKNHIKNGVKSLWTWKDNNFTCIYKNYSETDKIYTPQQLLEELENPVL